MVISTYSVTYRRKDLNVPPPPVSSFIVPVASRSSGPIMIEGARISEQIYKSKWALMSSCDLIGCRLCIVFLNDWCLCWCHSEWGKFLGMRKRSGGNVNKSALEIKKINKEIIKWVQTAFLLSKFYLRLIPTNPVQLFAKLRLSEWSIRAWHMTSTF